MTDQGAMLSFLSLVQFISNAFVVFSKEEAGLKTAKLRDEKEVYDTQQQADIEALKYLEENLEQLRNREKELASQESQMKARLKHVTDAIKENTKELGKSRHELSVMQDRHRNSR